MQLIALYSAKNLPKIFCRHSQKSSKNSLKIPQKLSVDKNLLQLFNNKLTK